MKSLYNKITESLIDTEENITDNKFLEFTKDEYYIIRDILDLVLDYADPTNGLEGSRYSDIDFDVCRSIIYCLRDNKQLSKKQLSFLKSELETELDYKEDNEEADEDYIKDLKKLYKKVNKILEFTKESLLEPEVDIVDKKFCYKVGSYYNDGKIKGIVASLKNNGDPHLIMSLDQPKEEMTWYDVMRYNMRLKDGWHIPSKEELEEVWHDDPKVTDILNRALKKHNGTKLNWYYWSSSEYNEYYAWLVYNDYSSVKYGNKGSNCFARAFIKL